MSGKILMIGVGDAGTRIAFGLAHSGRVDELVLAGLSGGVGANVAALVESCHTLPVKFVPLDATRQADVERLLLAQRPDVVVNCAVLMRPWPAMSRSDPVVTALSRGGLGLHLPAQLPCLLSIMGAVGEVGFDGPVANLSFPDATNAVLARLGLAPTLGLGNVSIAHLRVLAALRHAGQDPLEVGPVRLIGHHKHVIPVVASEPSPDPAFGPRVYLGNAGDRRDELAYLAPPIVRSTLPPAFGFNTLTAASALPVLLALLPDAPALSFSVPAPLGHPGGFPVRIEAGRVELDLPPGVGLAESLDYLHGLGRLDGIERIDDEGVVHFTEAAQTALAGIEPGIAQPLAPQEAMARFRLLAELLAA